MHCLGWMTFFFVGGVGITLSPILMEVGSMFFSVTIGSCSTEP